MNESTPSENSGSKNVGRDYLQGIYVDPDCLSSLFNVSIARVGQIAREISLPRNRDKCYPLEESVKGYIEWLRSRMRAPAGKGNEKGKDRKTALESEVLAMKLQEKRGELIPVKDVEREWAAIIGAVKTKILAIPVKAAPFLAPVTDPAEVKSILETFLREVLNELADGQTGDPGPQKKVPPKAQGNSPEIPQPLPAAAAS